MLGGVFVKVAKFEPTLKRDIVYLECFAANSIGKSIKKKINNYIKRLLECFCIVLLLIIKHLILSSLSFTCPNNAFSSHLSLVAMIK
jgi:hypothetical protein